MGLHGMPQKGGLTLGDLSRGDIVLEAEHLAALHGEVAAAGEAHRVATRGPVERLGDRRPPVDHDRLAVLVGRKGQGRPGSSCYLHDVVLETVQVMHSKFRAHGIEVETRFGASDAAVAGPTQRCDTRLTICTIGPGLE